jgi:tRNA modification GTPase
LQEIDSGNVVVELTPAGRGAVAVVLMAGPDAGELVGRFFHPAGRFRANDLPLNRIVFGRWEPGGEELVVCRRTADQVEVHCHGGDAAARAIIEQFVQCGCKHRSWRQWLQRTEPDPIRVAAQIALAEAPTARTVAILLDQFHGALASSLRAAMAAIDAADWSKAAEIIGDLLSRRELGLHLTTPWQVVVAGPPNVGKSSLINAIAGFERAIVSPLPGTTRDVVTVSTAIDGWPVQLADTAGLRAAGDHLESAGMELAAKAIAAADLVIFVEDATASGEDRPRMRRLYSPALLPVRRIHVRNKIDLVRSHVGESLRDSHLPLKQTHLRARTGHVRASESPDSQAPSRNWPTVATSALTGEGIAELIAAIGRGLVPEPPALGAAVPFTELQAVALASVQAIIGRRDPIGAADALRALLRSNTSD